MSSLLSSDTQQDKSFIRSEVLDMLQWRWDSLVREIPCANMWFSLLCRVYVIGPLEHFKIHWKQGMSICKKLEALTDTVVHQIGQYLRQLQRDNPTFSFFFQQLRRMPAVQMDADERRLCLGSSEEPSPPTYEFLCDRLQIDRVPQLQDALRLTLRWMEEHQRSMVGTVMSRKLAKMRVPDRSRRRECELRKGERQADEQLLFEPTHEYEHEEDDYLHDDEDDVLWIEEATEYYDDFRGMQKGSDKSLREMAEEREAMAEQARKRNRELSQEVDALLQSDNIPLTERQRKILEQHEEILQIEDDPHSGDHNNNNSALERRQWVFYLAMKHIPKVGYKHLDEPLRRRCRRAIEEASGTMSDSELIDVKRRHKYFYRTEVKHTTKLGKIKGQAEAFQRKVGNTVPLRIRDFLPANRKRAKHEGREMEVNDDDDDHDDQDPRPMSRIKPADIQRIRMETLFSNTIAEHVKGKIDFNNASMARMAELFPHAVQGLYRHRPGRRPRALKQCLERRMWNVEGRQQPDEDKQKKTRLRHQSKIRRQEEKSIEQEEIVSDDPEEEDV